MHLNLYTDAERPRPVLLLHSWGGDGDTWASVRQELAPRTTFAPDLPGHGGSSIAAFTVDRACEVAEAAIRGVPRAHVVGSGTGSIVALAIATHIPDRVASLTVAGFPPHSGVAAEQRVIATAQTLEQLGSAGFATNYATDTVVSCDPRARDDVARAMTRVGPTTLIETLRFTLFAPIEMSPAGSLPAECPRLVVRGALDSRVPMLAAANLARKLGARLAAVPDAGHLAFIDRPDAFADCLTQHFLQAEETGPTAHRDAPSRSS